MANSFIDEFPRLIVEIRRLSRTDANRAEQKAKSLAALIRQQVPLTNDPAEGIRRAEMLEEVGLLLREIRLLRYQSGGSMPDIGKERMPIGAPDRARCAGLAGFFSDSVACV